MVEVWSRGQRGCLELKSLVRRDMDCLGSDGANKQGFSQLAYLSYLIVKGPRGGRGDLLPWLLLSLGPKGHSPAPGAPGPTEVGLGDPPPRREKGLSLQG